MSDYKCPNCGAPLAFDSGLQELLCAHCGSEVSVEGVKTFQEEDALPDAKAKWPEYGTESGSGDWSGEDMNTLCLAVCNSCGGQLIGEKTVAASTCPYCGNVMILENQLRGALKPDFVIPFQLDKTEAKQKLAQFYKGKWLLPSSFASENHLESIQGIYVPFWLFDCRTQAHVVFDAKKVSHRSDSSYNYTTTRHYLCTRDGSCGFANIPVDGSRKMDDTCMEAIEPFNYAQLAPFTTSYLAGYSADKYDVGSSEASARADDRVRTSIISMLRDTVNGYTSVTQRRAQVSLASGEIEYALLPVWVLTTKYKDKMYTFAVNGQTGKVTGNMPISPLRYAGFLLGSFVVLAGAFIGGYTLYLSF
jgi:DNA-directed RNA polymerase subunit RPC12/RpoP